MHAPASGAPAVRATNPCGSRCSRGLVHGLLVGLLGAACSSAPPYAGWTAEQLFEHGQRAFDEGDWGEARRAFERLVLTFPLFDQAVDARFFMAQAFYRDEDYIGAIAEFQRLVDVYPDHERADAAWMGLCRAHAALSPHPQRDQRSTMQALRTCSNVASDLRGTPIGDSAVAIANDMNDKLAERLYGEGLVYFRRNILDSAELYFRDLWELYPNSASTPKALAHLVHIYDEWGWDDQHEEFRTRLLEVFPDSPEARGLATPAAADTVSLVRSRAPPIR